MSTVGQCPFCHLPESRVWLGGNTLLKMEAEWLQPLDDLMQGMAGGGVP